MSKKLPVLVLSGFLGSGKTTLINKLLTNTDNLRIALLINDIGEVNIDAELIRKKGLNISQTDENVVEISNGCICCTLREDLLIEVKKIYEQKKFDYLIIESSGISEPIPVAQTFVFDTGDKNSLDKITKLDCMATVVDCSTFLETMQQSKSLNDISLALNEDDNRSIAGLLIEQIEFCNLIILTKADLTDQNTVQKTKAILNKLNPYCDIIEAIDGGIDFEYILDTNLFDFNKASSQAGWIKELQKGEHTPETEEYGITTFTFRARKPFDKDKFHKLLNSDLLANVIRSKGYYWIQSDSAKVYELSQAGKNIEYGSTIGYWWAAINQEDWNVSAEHKQKIKDSFIEPFYEIGDRRQEIVFIGQNLDNEKITQKLNDCLVT
jgi:G3E family GTPase